jgi:hypothetical protein
MDCFDRDQHVYFALGKKTGLIKVGISIKPADRCRLSGWLLLGVIPGCPAREAAVHFALRHRAADQNEWFVPSPEVWAAVGEAVTTGDLAWLSASPAKWADTRRTTIRQVESHFKSRAAACDALLVNETAFTNGMSCDRPSVMLWSRWQVFQKEAA